MLLKCGNTLPASRPVEVVSAPRSTLPLCIYTVNSSDVPVRPGGGFWVLAPLPMLLFVNTALGDRTHHWPFQ